MNLLKLSAFIGNSTDVQCANVIQGTLQQIAENFKIPVVAPKDQGYFIRGEASVRNDESLAGADVLVMDGDSSLEDPKSCIPPKDMHEFLVSQNINHFMYTTHSHGKSKNKFRVVIPCKMSCKEQLQATAKLWYDRINRLGCGIALNVETTKWSQPWFKANVARERRSLFEFYEYYEGIDLVAVPEELWEQDKATKGEYTYSEDPKYKEALDKLRTGEDMHNSIISLGNYFASQDVSISFARNFLEAEIKNADRDHTDIHSRLSALNLNLKNCYDNIAASKAAVVATTVEIVEVEEDDGYTRGERMDDGIFFPDNLLGELTRALLNTWWVPNYMIASLTARATVAYLAGGNYKGSLGDRMNTQQVAIGSSGCGKDLLVTGVASVVSKLFPLGKSNLATLLNGIIDEAGSAEGLDDKLRSLGNKHDIIFVKDEIGGLLQSAAQGNDHKRGILEYALRMYTKANGVSNVRVKARKKNDDEMPVLYAPHFLINGATTPELIIKGLNAELLGTGNMSRLMFFNADWYKQQRLRQCEDLVFSEKLTENLKALLDTSALTKGNVNIMPMARVSNPVIVDFDEEIAELCYQESVKDDKLKGLEAVIKTRRVVNAKKYAMIEAVLEDPRNPTVYIDNLKRQLYFVGNALDYTAGLFAENVGEHKHEVAMKAVVKLAKSTAQKSPDGWVKKRVLLNNRPVKALTPTEIDNLFRHMVHSGFLEHTEVANARGRASQLYRLATD